MEMRRYLIAGKVQGVGFRFWTVGRARLLGLAGWVKNRADGGVEVVARGQPYNLDMLAGQLWDGPAMARVERVELAPLVEEGKAALLATHSFDQTQ